MRIIPSQVVQATNQLFGGESRNELNIGMIQYSHRHNVKTILSLLDQIPSSLITLEFNEYMQYLQSCAALTSAVALWNAGQYQAAENAGGSDPIARIRRLLLKCPDEIPPAYPEFAFVSDDDVRDAVTEAARAAWVNFQAQQWLGATVFAAVAIESLLLWALKQESTSASEREALDKQHLADFIKRGEDTKLLRSGSADQARLAKDARNLIHPGRVAREGTSCDKGSALAALAGLERVAIDLRDAWRKRSAAAGRI
jgi:hypothetical protein